MTLADRVEHIRKRYGLTPEQQLAHQEARAIYWDEVQASADRQPGKYVPGAFRKEGDEHRAYAAELRQYLAAPSQGESS